MKGRSLGGGLSARLSEREQLKIEMIRQFWHQLHLEDDPGATTWEVLDPLEHQVVECLDRDPPDVSHADSLTAQAFHLWVGNKDL